MASTWLGWVGVGPEYSGNASTYSYGNGSYGNYANLQLAQMAQVAQQRVTYSADYWKRHAGGPVPGPILGRHFESVVVDELAQMAQQQAQAQRLANLQANSGHYWETPSQREYDRRKRQELEELTKRTVPAVLLNPVPVPELKPDPFRQLCTHDFHALLDKFRKMGVA